MEEHYGFSLINFANVIADVLAERTIFSQSRYCKSVYNKLQREMDALNDVKKLLLRKLKKYLSIFLENRETKDGIQLDQLSDDEIVDYFGLREFFNRIDCIKKNPEEENIFSRLLVTSSYHKELFLKSRKPITPINQLVNFFAMVIFKPKILIEPDGRVTRASTKIDWEDISTLLTWFYQKLEKSVYGKKLSFQRKHDFSGWPDTLKVQYSKIGKNYRPALIGYCINDYFPKEKGPSIISIAFYRKRIKKIFQGDQGLIVLEYIFGEGRPLEIKREYSAEKDNRDEKGRILVIP